jgi:hypothetical protein
MQLIESKTLGTAQASLEFTSIPDSFTDLYFLVSARTTQDGLDNLRVQINSSASGHSSRGLIGTGSSVTIGADSNTANIPFLYVAGNYTANTFSNHSLYFPNYSSTTLQKSILTDGVMENNATAAYQSIQVGLFASTNAITTVRFFASNNLEVGTTISMYGITKGSDGIVTTS